MSHVKALIKLSGFDKTVTPKAIVQLAKDAPDPETIARAVLKRMHSDSPALAEKWRKTLGALWADHHPDVPLLPDLPITKKQATSTFLLLDTLGFLDELSRRPAALGVHEGRVGLRSRDVKRLAAALESLREEAPTSIRSEADVPLLRSLRETLLAARLLKTYQGELQVVRSRLKTFLRLPRSYQWFVLWHAQVYHVCWGEFAFDWHDELHVVQDYLPLLWDMSASGDDGEIIDKHNWCLNLMEAFAPLWGQHGLLRAHVRLPLLTFFHESALPAVLNEIILNDLFARYGLIQFDRDGNFIWTPLGITLLDAERSESLPCGLELL